MKEIPYRTRMTVPEDCIGYTDKDGIKHYDFYHPFGAVQKNEMDCMEFESPETQDIGYHEHTFGCETFLITNGQIEGCVLGQRFLMGPGDILHIQPYMGHAFKPASPGCRLNILFQTMDMANTTARRFRVQENFPGKYEEPELQAALDKLYGRVPRTFPDAPLVPAEQVAALRREGTGLLIHEAEGVTLRLKVGRWETHGEKEIWELVMQQGFGADHPALRPEPYFFYVTEGKVRFRIREAEDRVCEFDAEAQTLVNIPPLYPFSYEAAAPSRMLDLDCAVFRQDLLEEIERLRAREPEKLNDADYMRELRHRFNCWYENAGLRK